MSSGLASGGFFTRSHPRGSRLLESRSTTWLRALLVDSDSEYGSVTWLVTTCWVLGAQTFTS